MLKYQQNVISLTDDKGRWVLPSRLSARWKNTIRGQKGRFWNNARHGLATIRTRAAFKNETFQTFLIVFCDLTARRYLDRKEKDSVVTWEISYQRWILFGFVSVATIDVGVPRTRQFKNHHFPQYFVENKQVRLKSALWDETRLIRVKMSTRRVY